MEHKTAFVKMADIHVDASFNCRGEIPIATVIPLAKNIKANGLIQPVVVGAVQEDGKRLLISGYRRMMAHRYLKRDEIFCVLRDDLTYSGEDVHLLLINLQENIQRENLNIIQEGNTLVRLIDAGIKEGDLPTEINRPKAWVRSRLAATRLPKQLHADILNGRFTAKHVTELYTSMTTKPVEEFAEDVRWIKEGREKGKKNISLESKAKAESKAKSAVVRSRAEMYRLQGHIDEKHGVGTLPARILGWCNGHVTGEDILAEIDAYE